MNLTASDLTKLPLRQPPGDKNDIDKDNDKEEEIRVRLLTIVHHITYL